MNKITFFLVFTIITLARAQSPTEFWGSTPHGGPIGNGTVFKTDSNGDHQVITDAFNGQYSGKWPYKVQFCEASNGKFYCTMQGGIYGMGMLAEFDIQTKEFNVKKYFTKENGYTPNSLVKGVNNKLYGTCSGTMSADSGNVKGSLFEYDIATNQITTKVVFNGTNGSHPDGNLLVLNEKLYGTTRLGGATNSGVLFEYDVITGVYTVKASMDNSIYGYESKNGLIKADNGNLYGMRSGEGSGLGSIFEYNFSTNTISKKADVEYLNCIENGGDGFIYGLTSGTQINANNFVNGTLFKLDPVTSATNTIYTFNEKLAFPCCLKKCKNNLFYGLTYRGGTNNQGTLFEFNPANNLVNKLIDFSTTDGKGPVSILMQASNEKLYATTNYGGTNNLGTIFEYRIDGAVYKKMYDFQEGVQTGSTPVSGMTLAPSGKLYFTASNGGINDSGALIECDPSVNNGTFRKIFDFDSIHTSRPDITPTLASNGKLYGTTKLGGLNNRGILYEFDPTTNSVIKKLDLDQVTSFLNGFWFPASNHKLYGLTESNSAIIFEFDPSTGQLTQKKQVDYLTIGNISESALIQNSKGKLFGTTSNSGGKPDNSGSIFEYDILTDSIIKRADIIGRPVGKLVEVPNGKLYGLSWGGGDFYNGMLYEFDPEINESVKIKHHFSGNEGSAPMGSLMLASNGKLYGMAGGGEQNDGTFFEYDYIHDIFTKKLDFKGSNGLNPLYNSLIEICKSVYIVQQPSILSVCDSTPLSINSGVSAIGHTFQWFKDGSKLEGATQFSYLKNSAVFADSGNYYCIVNNGCRSVQTPTTYLKITPFNPTGCEGNGIIENLQNMIKIYPNPFVNTLQIDCGNVSEHHLIIQVNDMLGRSLLKKDILNNGQIMQLSMETLSPGFYSIRIMNESNQLFKSQKLIKQY